MWVFVNDNKLQELIKLGKRNHRNNYYIGELYGKEKI